MSIGKPPPGDPPTPSDERPSIGRALARARTDAGLTVDEVSARTRVRIPIVHAIEQDDFSLSGGDFYARGHIRLLAKAVGIDPETLVARYDAEHGSVAITPRQIFEADRTTPERRRPNWTAAMVAAIAVVIAIVGFNLFSGGLGAGHHQVAGKPTTTPPASRQATGSPTPTKPAPSSSAIAAVPADKVTVKLTAVGKSWVSAIGSNGDTLFQNVLDKGDSKTFTDDKQLKLVVGNAGGVKMFVNGKDLGPAGDKGAVVRLTFTPGDPEAG